MKTNHIILSAVLALFSPYVVASSWDADVAKFRSDFKTEREKEVDAAATRAGECVDNLLLSPSFAVIKQKIALAPLGEATFDMLSNTDKPAKNETAVIKDWVAARKACIDGFDQFNPPALKPAIAAAERRFTLIAAKLVARQITYGEFSQARAEINEALRAQFQAVADEDQAALQRKEAADREARQHAEQARQRQAQQEYAEYVRRQAAEEAQRAAATAGVLQAIGNAFTRSSQQIYTQPRPPTNCISSPMGGSITTSCY